MPTLMAVSLRVGIRNILWITTNLAFLTIHNMYLGAMKYINHFKKVGENCLAHMFTGM